MYLKIWLLKERNQTKQFLQLLLHYKLWCKQDPTGQMSLVFAAQDVTKVGSKVYYRRFQKDCMQYPEKVRINLPKRSTLQGEKLYRHNAEPYTSGLKESRLKCQGF